MEVYKSVLHEEDLQIAHAYDAIARTYADAGIVYYYVSACVCMCFLCALVSVVLVNVCVCMR